MDHTVPLRFSGYSGMDIGRDNGLPVDRRYAGQSPFTGTIRKVVFDINPTSVRPTSRPCTNTPTRASPPTA